MDRMSEIFWEDRNLIRASQSLDDYLLNHMGRGNLGPHLKEQIDNSKYPWLINDYKAIKTHTDLDRLPRHLLLPERTDLSDLFTACHYTSTDAKSADLFFLSTPYSQHLKAKWTCFYVRPRTCLLDLVRRNCCDGQIGSFELIRWNHHGPNKYLFLAHDGAHIGNPWISIVTLPDLDLDALHQTEDGLWSKDGINFHSDPWSASK